MLDICELALDNEHKCRIIIHHNETVTPLTTPHPPLSVVPPYPPPYTPMTGSAPEAALSMLLYLPRWAFTA